MTPEEYIKAYTPDAKKVQTITGMDYRISLTQGALESSWGTKAPGFNFFGIKDTDGVNGNEQLITTTEYLSTPNAKFPSVISIIKQGVNRFKYTVKDWFRKYPSAEMAFADHANFIIKNPRYSEAVKVMNDPMKFFDAVAAAHYAA